MIILDYKDRRPIYEQLEDKITEMIHMGVFTAGEQLPSVRNLAMELSINPNTIQRTISELEKKGIIYSVKGKGSFVADQQELVEMRIQKLQEELQKLADKAVKYGWTLEELQDGLAVIWQSRKQNKEGGNSND